MTALSVGVSVTTGYSHYPAFIFSVRPHFSLINKAGLWRRKSGLEVEVSVFMQNLSHFVFSF